VDGSVSHELGKHGQSSFGLIHGDHMSGLVNSVEGEAVDVLVFTITSQNSVVFVLEFALMGPLQFVDPFLTASPVADEVKITRVDQDGVVFTKEVSNIARFVSEPVLHHMLVDGHVALRPGVSSDTNSFLDIRSGKEVINDGEVVAEGSMAGEFNVIDVEFGGISGDFFNTDLALGQSDGPGSVLDEVLAETEGLDEGVVGRFVNELVFVGISGVLGILPVSRDETVSDSRALEVDISVVLLLKVSRDGRDVMSGIRFTSDEELSSLELGELFQELLHEGVEILGNFGFRVFEGSGIGVASTDGLVNVQEIGIVVP